MNYDEDDKLGRLFSQVVPQPMNFEYDNNGNNSNCNNDGNGDACGITTLPSKTFNDPIHGLIDVEYMLVKIIDTPYIQRLRNLKQLGAGSFVFPGAGHNRFQHSLGTMHLAGQMAKALRRNDMTGEISQVLTDKVILLLKVAGLGHDLGHGPLSHCFDGLFIPHLIRTTDDEELKEKLSKWEHEDASEKMIEAAIRHAGLTDVNRYDDPITDDEILYIKSLINPDEHPIETRPFPHLAFTYDIISNSRCSIDVDKFDYLERDCMNAGLRSAFRFEQLISNCKVIDNQITFHKKVAWEVYSLFHTRYSLFKQVYSHRKVKSVEYMITDAMMLADPCLQIGRRVLDLDQYLKLDDSIVQMIETYPVDVITNEKNKEDMIKAQTILTRLRNRDLYKYCAESLLPDYITTEKRNAINSQLVFETLQQLYPNGESKLTVDDIVIQKMTLNYAFKDKNPVDNVKFYSSLWDTTAHHIPKEKISLLAPSRFAEHYVRIFIKINNPDEKIRAARALDQCLVKHLDESSGLTKLDQHHLDLVENINNSVTGAGNASGGINGNNSGDDQFNAISSTTISRFYSQQPMSQHVLGNTSSQIVQAAAVKLKLGVVNDNISLVQRTNTQNGMNASSQNYTSSNNFLSTVRNNSMMDSSNNNGSFDTGNNDTGLGTPKKRSHVQVYSTTLSTTQTPRRQNNTNSDLPQTPILKQTHIDDTDSDVEAIDGPNFSDLNSQTSMVSTNTTRATGKPSTTKAATKATGSNKRQKLNDSSQVSILKYMGTKQ